VDFRRDRGEALARLIGWRVTLKELALSDALLEVRQEGR
jgi:hypothetical protein